jgi:hypothetical protein
MYLVLIGSSYVMPLAISFTDIKAGETNIHQTWLLLPAARPPEVGGRLLSPSPLCPHYNHTSSFSHTLQNLLFFLQLFLLGRLLAG